MNNTVYLILYTLAVPATVILILQTVLLLFGLGHNADADSDADFGHDGDFVDMDHDGIPDDIDDDIGGIHGAHTHDAGLRLFTVRGIVAFFAVGGWAGIAALELGASEFISVVAAILLGLVALIVVALFFKWALSLRYDGTTDLKNAVGRSAEVYITVPANHGGKGKINVVIQERYVEMEAVTDEDTAIKYGERVRVTAMADSNTAIVAREHQ